MVMKRDEVVPFGRSLDEYRHMFALTEADLDRTIVGVGDGPASFNAKISALGHSVVSVDPLYDFDGNEIRSRFDTVVDNIVDQVESTPSDWTWSYHPSLDHLRQTRLEVLRRFVDEFDTGRGQGGYVTGELPNLDFDEDQFQLALCSPLLFLYSDRLTYDFHLAPARQMLRVAREVRIFPLLTFMLDRSLHLEPLVDALRSEGNAVSVVRVVYELPRGGNEMLQIRRAD